MGDEAGDDEFRLPVSYGTAVNVLLNQAHAWVFLALGALAVAGVVWFYRRVPPRAGRLRPVLVALRAAALALLFVALVEPVLALSRTLVERPVVGVLLDASRSMSVADGTGGVTRGEEAVSLLNEVMLGRIARDAEVAAYSFSAGRSALEMSRGVIARSPSFDGGATDIAGAIESLTDELAGANLSALVVATDGASNRGPGPYEAAVAAHVPVFVLGVGRQEPGTDIAIEDAVTNRISYAGESVPVEVIVGSSGFEGAETVVELSEGGVVLDSRHVELSGTGEESRVTFRVTPVEPGVHRYSITVPPAAGELSTANNTRVVVTTAMKGKIRALLVAERPGYDLAFLRREFESDRNVELEVVVRKRGAQSSQVEGTPPASLAELYEYDLVVAMEPDWNEPLVPNEWLATFVTDRGGGLLFVGALDGPEPAALEAVLPLGAARSAAVLGHEVRVRLTEEGELSPVTRVAEDRFESAELWRELPPVHVGGGVPISARADATVLLEGTDHDAGATPVLAVRRAGAGNVMAVAADGLWRWKMARRGDVDVYGRFVTNAARWLTARGELERVVVTPDKDVFQAGEDIGFSAQVYRGDFRLARDAEVVVEVASSEGAAPVASLELVSDGDRYRGTTGHLSPGPYVLRARASLGGEEVGTAESEFIVERFSLEDSETRRRSAVLRRVAEETGGGYYTPETLSELPEEVPLSFREREATSEFELWNSPWLLLGFVGLMSAEWALRRKQGLP